VANSARAEAILAKETFEQHRGRHKTKADRRRITGGRTIASRQLGHLIRKRKANDETEAKRKEKKARQNNKSNPDLEQYSKKNPKLPVAGKPIAPYLHYPR
jgi:hypothetical protein